MTALIRSVTLLSLACAGLGACSQYSLNPTYGEIYRSTFSAQLAERSIRPPAPINGDEAKRIIGGYLEGLGGGGSAPAPSGPAAGGSSGAGLNLKGR